MLGSIADSAKYSRRIETAIVTTPAEAQETVDAVAMQLGYRDIIVVPDLRELPTLWVRTRDLNGLIGLQMRRNLLLRRNRLLKQTIDYLIALPLFARQRADHRGSGALGQGRQRGLAVLRPAPRGQGRTPDQGLEAQDDVP